MGGGIELESIPCSDNYQINLVIIFNSILYAVCSIVAKWVKIVKTERTLEIQQARLTEECSNV